MKFFALAALLSTAASGFVSQKTFVRTTALEATRRPFISGNWKLNPQTREDAVQLAADIASSITIDSPNADVAVFVPYVFIEAAMNSIGNSKVTIGAEVCKTKTQ
jgi:triosephosphate isomerase